ncbi:MAG: aldo/keto reductase [Gemmatimonadales bacterium]|nr:aldo/keto reductase [Gemmatimonadales bacterium]
MEHRRIGSLEVSVVGLGCNNFGARVDYQGSAAVVRAALDAGIDFFDTADSYGGGRSEEFIGRALSARRSEVILATKFGMHLEGQGSGARPEYVASAAEASLRRLGTDRIDLYQLHTPDPSVPIADTLGAMNDLVQAGKVREIGCSNLSVEQLREAANAVRPAAARFASVQNQYSLLHREPEEGVLTECQRLGLAFLPYFPLASGLLTGKYRRGSPPPEGTRLAASARYRDLLSDANLSVVEALSDYAGSKGHSLLELAISWLLAGPVIASVIAGATRPAQVQANAAAAGWRLSEQDLAEVDAMVRQAA